MSEEVKVNFDSLGQYIIISKRENGLIRYIRHYIVFEDDNDLKKFLEEAKEHVGSFKYKIVKRQDRYGIPVRYVYIYTNKTRYTIMVYDHTAECIRRKKL